MEAASIVSESYAGPAHKLHLDYLESIRGVAALSVVLFHYTQAYDGPRLVWFFTHTPLAVICDGTAAVSLFFVLSGLVLSYRHFRTSRTPDLSKFHIGAYAVARVCRIWLPYVVISLISALFSRQIFARYNTSPPPTDWLIFFFKNPHWPLSIRWMLGEIQIFRFETPSLLPQGWTLSIELALSILVPFGVMLASRRTSWLIVVVLMLTISMHGTAFLAHFAAGILIAKYFNDIQDWMSRHRLARWGTLIIGILFYTLRSTLDREWGWPGPAKIWLASGFGAALILCGVLGSDFLKRAFSHRSLRFLGRISYSLYLVHMLVLLCLTPSLMQAMSRWPLSVSWPVGVLTVTGVSLILAIIYYRLVEVPSMAIGKRIQQWITTST